MGGMLSWIALAIFSSVLLMVLVFSEPAHSAFCAFSEKSGTSCLRDFLSEFQTLITGLAVVIAASATVYVMIRTDAAHVEIGSFGCGMGVGAASGRASADTHGH